MKRYLSWIVLLVAAAVFVSTHLMWMQSLPERVATHFNAVGKVNGWMSRSTHSTFMLLFGLGLPCFIMVLMWVMRFLPPNLMNVPNAAYWRSPEHYPAAMQFMQEWSRWFAAGELLWVSLLNHQIVVANQNKPPHLATAPTLWLTGVFLIVVGASIVWMIIHFSRTPTATPPVSP